MLTRGMVVGTEDGGSTRSDKGVLGVLAGALPLSLRMGGTFSLPGPFASFSQHKWNYTPDQQQPGFFADLHLGRCPSL
jgi:hypothetical protein